MKPVLLAAVAFLLLLPATILCQRDYFTPEEVEIIRDAQQIDRRVDALVRMIDRRFAALNVNVNAPTYKEVKGVEWGQPPTGSRLDLLIDIKRILQKAVDDIDNLSERPNSMYIEEPDPKDKHPKKQASFAELFPIAVHNLAAAANRYGPVLKTELDKTKLPEEKGAILDSIEMCDEIVAAVNKLPASTPADPKKSKN